MVGNVVFSETTLRIFLIFWIKLGDYKGRKVTEPDFWKKFLIWRYSPKGLQISPKSDTLIFFSKTALMIFLVFGLKLALNMTFNLNETYFSEKFVICNLVFVLEIAKTWLFSYNSPAQSVYSCFKQNFNISFCQISNLSCYLNKNELSTNCYENH